LDIEVCSEETRVSTRRTKSKEEVVVVGEGIQGIASRGLYVVSVDIEAVGAWIVAELELLGGEVAVISGIGGDIKKGESQATLSC
jgi:hypothetical protein